MSKTMPAAILFGLLILPCVGSGCSSSSAASQDLLVDQVAEEIAAGEVDTEDIFVSFEDNVGEMPLAVDVAIFPDLPDVLTDVVDEWWWSDATPDVTPDAIADTAPELLPDLGWELQEDTFQPDNTEEAPPLFDLALLSDPATANCTFTDHHTILKGTTLLDVWQVSYTSFESVDGELAPIEIKAFAARPVLSGDNLPGIVQAHGLGGFAKEAHASGTAALLGMFVLAYTGPGGGDAPDNTSEGLPSGWEDGYRMFDTVPDPRGTWFWGHAVAAMRGLTCLEHHPAVDPLRLGMTGYSAGGVATLIASSVDPRIKVAVPLSGTLAWDVATQSPGAWQHTLLNQAGLSTASQQWLVLMDTIVSSQALLPGNGAKVMMVNGSTDEFFPLTAHMDCFSALPGADKRTSIAANFDHGCYALTGGESASAIEERAAIRAEGGQRLWFRHWFQTDDDYGYVPTPPQVTVQAVGPVTMVTAVVDPGGSKLEVEEVKVWASNDDSFFFASVDLANQGNGLYSEMAWFTLQENTVLFVDVQYRTQSLLFPERFSISSPPQVPATLVPHIRNIDSCM